MIRLLKEIYDGRKLLNKLIKKQGAITIGTVIPENKVG